MHAFLHPFLEIKLVHAANEGALVVVADSSAGLLGDLVDHAYCDDFAFLVILVTETHVLLLRIGSPRPMARLAADAGVVLRFFYIHEAARLFIAHRVAGKAFRVLGVVLVGLQPGRFLLIGADSRLEQIERVRHQRLRPRLIFLEVAFLAVLRPHVLVFVGLRDRPPKK